MYMYISMQVLKPDESDYNILYRGGNTKFTWKTELERSAEYKFRVQVRTTEGVGNWSDPVTAYRAEPGRRVGPGRRGFLHSVYPSVKLAT